MKWEWKKQEKQYYSAKEGPAHIHLPVQNFLAIDGQGNPNDANFSERVGAMYALAYAIKMQFKANAKGQETDDFTVYPLEGIWRKKEGSADELKKEELVYTLLIRQPDFISPEQMAVALESVKRKKPHPLYTEIYWHTLPEGDWAEVLHLGSYDDEPASFAKMDAFAKENGWVRQELWHRELYLNNAGRVSTEKLRTILRYPVRQA